MRFEIVPFDSAHIHQIDVQEAQRIEVGKDDALAVPFGDAWSALVDGVPVGCAGVVGTGGGRAYAWALLSKGAGPWMLAITKAVRRGINVTPYARIDMVVEAGFEAGMRWAVLLGFKLEKPEPEKDYLPDGRDAYIFSMVR